MEKWKPCFTETSQFIKLAFIVNFGKALQSFDSESAFHFMERVTGQFTDLYGKNKNFEKRQVTEQFLNGFQRQGKWLSEEHKQFIRPHGNIKEMAFHAERIMEVLSGSTNKGDIVCYKCCSVNHMAKDCKSQRLCATCQSTKRTTRMH